MVRLRFFWTDCFLVLALHSIKCSLSLLRRVCHHQRHPMRRLSLVTSVAQANGGFENMINWNGKDQDILALIKYIADEDKLEKVLENPQVIKTPVVRNGKQSTLGYQPDVWKGWN